MHPVLDEDQSKFLLWGISRFVVGDSIASLHSAQILHMNRGQNGPKNTLPFFCGTGFILGLTFRTCWAILKLITFVVTCHCDQAFYLKLCPSCPLKTMGLGDSGCSELVLPSGITFSCGFIYPQANLIL